MPIRPGGAAGGVVDTGVVDSGVVGSATGGGRPTVKLNVAVGEGVALPASAAQPARARQHNVVQTNFRFSDEPPSGR